MTKKILVTGATGFVGRVLCGELMRAGYDVRAAVRGDSRVLANVGDKVVVGELSGSTDWTHAVDGVDAVVHLAARVHIMHPGPDDQRLFDQVNVQATGQLIEAAAAAGVKRFIQLSSVKVNGEDTPRDGAFTADDQPQPQDDYGRSKWRGEQCMFEVAAKHGIEALAIRSPLVYGPEVRANFLRLMQLVHRGLPLPLGAVDNRRSMISVWNLCDLITHAARAESTGSAVLMASDGEDISTAQLIRYLAAAMSRPSRLIPVPPALLQLLGRLTGKQAEVSRLIGSLRVDSGATQLRLRWRPPLSVQEGIERTARWFVAEQRVANGF